MKLSFWILAAFFLLNLSARAHSEEVVLPSTAAAATASPLDGLQSSTETIFTNWPFGKANYEGVLLRNLLPALPGSDNPGADKLRVRCADGHETFIPLSTLKKYPIGLVTLIDGKTPDQWPLYKDKPLGYYIALPTLKFSELASPGFNNYWAWQVTGLDVVRMADLLGEADLAGRPDATIDVKRGQNAFVSQCIHCHKIGGAGGATGANLLLTVNGVGAHTPASFEKYVLDPKSVYPGSRMPAFKGILTPRDVARIRSYLNALTKGQQ